MSGGATIFGAGGGVNYGVDGSGNPQQILADNQALRVSLYGKTTTGGDTALQLTTSLPAGIPILPAMPTIAAVHAYSEQDLALELWRNNSHRTLMASAVRSATTSSPLQVNRNYRALILLMAIQANPGAGENLTLDLCMDYASFPAVWEICKTPAMVGGTHGFGLLIVGPGSAEMWTEGYGAIQKAKLQTIIPKDWFVRVTHSGASAWTYSVEAMELV